MNGFHCSSFFIYMISVNLKLTHLCTRWTCGVHNTVKVILHMGVQCEVGVQNCVSAQRVFNYDLTLLNVRQYDLRNMKTRPSLA